MTLSPDRPETVCVYDWCGNATTPGFWADWNPVTGMLCFGGAWFDVPDVYFPREPTESQVTACVTPQNNWWARHEAAERARRKAHDNWHAQITKLYEKYGANRVYVKLANDAGDEKVFDQDCGLLEAMDCLQAASAIIAAGYTRARLFGPEIPLPPGMRIVAFKFTRKIPKHLSRRWRSDNQPPVNRKPWEQNTTS